MLTNKIFYLIKANFLNSFSLKTSNKVVEKIKIKKIFILSLLAFLYLFFLFLITSTYYMTGKFLEISDQTSIILNISFSLVTVICLFMSLYKGITYLFDFKDYDMLKAMPVTNGDIFASKVIQIYNSNMIWCFLIGYPGILIFNVLTHANIMVYLLSFIMFLFIPMIPMIIGCVISLLIGFLIVKSKLKKLFSILGTIILIGGSIFINIIINLTANSSEHANKAIFGFEKISNLYFLNNYFVKGISQLNYLNIILFLLINCGIILLFIVVFGKLFSKINGLMQEHSSSTKYEIKTLPQSSKIKALYKKELMLYTEYSAYIVNTAILPIFLLFYFVLMYIKGNEVTLGYIGISGGEYLLLINTAISVYLLSAPTTSSSISIEGIRFYIMKTLPISFEEIAIGKILVNATITLPILLICSILMYLSSNISIIEYFSYLTVTVGFCFLYTVIGLYINLLFPKMEWKTATEVLKRGMSVIVAMFINIIIIIIPIILYFIIKPTNNYIYLYIIGIIVIIIDIILWNIFKNHGKKLLSRI